MKGFLGLVAKKKFLMTTCQLSNVFHIQDPSLAKQALPAMGSCKNDLGELYA